MSTSATRGWVVAAVAVSTAFVLPSCGESPRHLAMPPEGEVVTAFPSGLQVGDVVSSDERPVEVTLAEPSGTIVELNAINIGFNQPMVDGTEVVDLGPSAPVTIEPALPGRFRWLGPRTLSFVPADKPAEATVYKVTVSGDVKSRAGTELGQDYTFSFSTPGLRITRYDPSWYNARLKPGDKIMVQFNLPVTVDAVREAARFSKLVAKNERVDVPFDVVPTKKDLGGDALKKGVAFNIVPKKPLELDSRYELQIGSQLKPAAGRLGLGRHWSKTFSTIGKFRVSEIRCGYGNCQPRSRWTVQFTNPVNPADIKKCVRFNPPLPIERAWGYGSQVTLQTKTPKAGRTYTLTARGCKDKLGNKLVEKGSKSYLVNHYRPTIRMTGGVQFMEPPKKGEVPRYPVTLLNVPDAHVRMLRLDEANLARFLVHFNSWSWDDLLKDTNFKPDVDRPYGINLAKDKAKTYGLRLDEVLGNDKAGVVFLDVQSKKWSDAYSWERYNRALVQVSDIGLTAKYSPESVLIWTTSLTEATPLRDVQVSLRTSDGEVLWTGVSDSSGIARGPGLNTFGNKKPRLLVAKRKSELAFLDLESWRHEIEPYRFSLPFAWHARASAVVGYVFTERGVYRPGEKVHVKGYLRYDDGKRLAELPTKNVDITVTDSQGNVALSRNEQLTEWGSFSVEVPVAKRAPLGTWSVEVTPRDMPKDADVAVEARGNFRVEAYRAPDFEVLVETDKPHAVTGDKLSFTASGQYLFGAPMNGADVSWYATRKESVFKPVGEKNFVFGPRADYWWWASPYDESRSAASDSGELDANGLLRGDFDLAEIEGLEGPQEVTIEAEVRDLNRQMVSGRSTVKLHPAEFYVGIRRPGYLVEAGEMFKPEIIAVDLDGKRISGKKVQVDLLQRTWNSVRQTTAGGGVTWVTEKKDVVKRTCHVTTAKTAKTCSFKLPSAGRYVVVAKSKDGDGREVTSSTSVYAYGGGWYWWGREDGERIDLVADKESYSVGDTAKIMVQSPYRKARALVTVERRGILEQKTIELNGSATAIDVPITDKMLPNAYVSVVLIRGRVENPKDVANKDDPGKPAFKMGYATINVDKSQQVLDVAVIPEESTYHPGDKVRAEVTLADSSGQAVSGEVTFMAVDEGVLSLTGYRTPNPVAALYKSQPIAVRTSETRTAVVSKVDMAEEDGMKGDEGGGGGYGGEAQNFRSAFATTATFLPTVQVGKNGKATVEFDLPDNLTAYRLMAVAVGRGNRFGSAEHRIRVQKPLMLRPSLPRFASTGDDFEVRTVVQAVGGVRGEVEVTVEATGPVELTGERTQKVRLDSDKPVELSWPAVVGSPGKAKFRFATRALSGFEGDDAVEMTIPVKYPAVRRNHLETGTLKPNRDDYATMWRRIEIPDEIRKDAGELEVQIASSAMGELLPGLSYLVDYPYGCIEQTTGRTLPLVAMVDLVGEFDLPGIPASDVNKFAQSGVDRLLTMQTYSGGLGYWPGASDPHPWGSAYGGLALVRASKLRASKTLDLEVPQDKLDRLLDYLRTVLRGEAEAGDYWSQHSMDVVRPFAAYVLAEAGAPEPSYHELLFNERESLPAFGKALLAMAIVKSSGPPEIVDALMRELLEGAHVGPAEASLAYDSADADRFWAVMSSPVRENSIALMALLASRPDDELTAKFAKGLLKSRRGGRWVSTQENAFAVMALASYFDQVEAREPDYRAVIAVGDDILVDKKFKGRSLAPERITLPMKDLAKHEGQVLTIMRDGSGGPLYYSINLEYVEAKPPKTNFDNGFTLMREYLAAEGPDAGKPITKVKPGELVQVRLTVVVPEERHYVAVEDPLPAGLEPVNTSFDTTSLRNKAKASKANRGDDDDWWWWYRPVRFNHIEQRDDRVLLFADFLNQGVYNHTYLARATTLGTFEAPSARVEEMYDPHVWGRSESRTLEVR